MGLKLSYKPELGKAIKELRNLNIRIRAYTSDSTQTTSAIAREANLLSNDEIEDRMTILTGLEFNRKFSDM